VLQQGIYRLVLLDHLPRVQSGRKRIPASIRCDRPTAPTVWSNPNGLNQDALLPRLAQSLMRPWEGAQ
jgi:hypothetical protein